MKVKIFEGTKSMVEPQINEWLAEHDADVAIVNMFVSASPVTNKETYALQSVTFIYRELVTPAKDGQPAVFK